jgi:hypothetical protein
MARPELLVALDRAARSEAPDADAEFDAALDRLLEQASTDAAPEPSLRHLVHERLQGSLAAGPVGAADAGNGAGSASGAATPRGLQTVVSPGVWTRYGSRLIILATGVAIGFVWGRAPSWENRPTATSPTAHVPTALALSPAPAEQTLAPVGSLVPPAVSETPVVSPTPAPPLAAQASRAPVEPGARPSAARSPSAPRARAHASSGATEQAESLRLVLEQLRKAQLYSRAGEHRLALGALDALDARVPLSVLQEEREVARTLALCDAGQEQAAAELAGRVIQRAPDSAYALSLRESCAGRAQLLEQMRERTSNRLP